MSTTHPAAPSLDHLAELLHQATAEAEGSFLVTVELGADDVAIGTWPVPSEVDHPADPFVGFLAPPSWDAIGLVANGRTHTVLGPDPNDPGPGFVPRAQDDGSAGDDDAAEDGEDRAGATDRPNVVRATVLADRHGQVASVLEQPGRSPQIITDPPDGWVPDALARALGQPTPPPADRLARWVEVAWLDAIARRALAAPGQVCSWAEVAHLHPLHPPGAALPGALLAVEAEAIDLESSWRRIRHLCTDPDRAPPPARRTVPRSRWPAGSTTDRSPAGSSATSRPPKPSCRRSSTPSARTWAPSSPTR